MPVRYLLFNDKGFRSEVVRQAGNEHSYTVKQVVLRL
jgi:hypothetical protein